MHKTPKGDLLLGLEKEPPLRHQRPASNCFFLLLDTKKKLPTFIENQEFTSFCFIFLWYLQKENISPLLVDYQYIIVYPIWKSTRFSTRLIFIILLASNTIVYYKDRIWILIYKEFE